MVRTVLKVARSTGGRIVRTVARNGKLAVVGGTLLVVSTGVMASTPTLGTGLDAASVITSGVTESKEWITKGIPVKIGFAALAMIVMVIARGTKSAPQGR